ncbi:lactosylceramide 1,3-N-acetyl-beta-D-glucosaminyltransferase A isoform 2-T6 [Pholidichthys leucotaenia]
MFITFCRIRKLRCIRLLTSVVFLTLVTVYWEDVDHHVVSHVRAYAYRYLVNRYDFLNSSFAISAPTDGDSPGFPYLINHPKKCDGNEEILLLLFVKSSPENAEQRQNIRETWGNESFARLLFAVGVHSDAERRRAIQRALLLEDHFYGDLIQQNFYDTFHNLTAKLLLQLHWSHAYCHRAQFLMSADDDVFVHVPNLLRYLQTLRSQSGARDLWVGHVHRGSPPVRRKGSKYQVSYHLYPWSSYPDYTAGGGYVVSADVAAKIYRAARVLNSSMYIDDVFMGICANAVGVSPQDHIYFSGEGKAPCHRCIYDHMITSHGHATNMRTLWREAMEVSWSGHSMGFMGNLYCTVVRVMLLCRPHFERTYSCSAAFI